MKHKFSTPFWIVISITIGLSSLVFSSSYLYKMIVSQPRAIVLSIDDKSPFDVKIKKNEHLNKIDTIFYSTAFHKGLSLNQRDILLKELLPEINNKASANLNPAIFRWIIFHSVSLSLCLASSIFIFYFAFLSYVEYKQYYNFVTVGVIILGVLSVIGSLYYISMPQMRIINGGELMTYFDINFNIPNNAIKIIVIPMFIVSLIPIIGIMMGNFGTYCAFENKIEPSPKSQEEKTKEYSHLKERLNIFAFYLGLLVSCAVIGSGLQRDMITNQIGDLLYPKEMIYAYGIAFSTILALFFIPSFMYLRYTGREYQNKIDTTNKEDWWKIGQDTIDNFKLALSVALPLISSVVQPIITGH